MPPTAPEQQPSNKARKISGGLKPSITIPGPALKAAAAMAAATVRVLGVHLSLFQVYASFLRPYCSPRVVAQQPVVPNADALVWR